MHIEPGLIAQFKVMLANASALGMMAYYAKDLIKQPADMVRTLVAALFFSLFMQSFHVPVGPSELHFVGAMVMYFTLGFLPTLLGFALGLLLQGLFFEPMDLPHLAVNALTLIVPLIAVHYTLGRKLRHKLSNTANDNKLNWQTILKLDAMYYSGVTAMVGFWLLIANVTTPFATWAAFATSYLTIIAVEPFITYGAIRLLKRYEHTRLVNVCFAVKPLSLAN